jgi:hypothetical protein
MTKSKWDLALDAALDKSGLRNFWNSRRRLDKIILVASSVVALFVVIGVLGSLSSDKGSKPTTAAARNTTSTSAKATTADATTTSKPEISEAQQHALNYIKDHGADANRVVANVMLVQIALLDLQKNPTQAKLNTLAITAQDAHDRLDAIRGNFLAGDSDAEALVFSGANDLKNSMGAIVTYTGDPNPATLASLTTQYKQAVFEWNTGVRSIWKAAKKKPPTL